MDEHRVHQLLVRNIRTRMDNAGMSVEQLAGLAVVGPAQIYRLFRYECSPTVRWLAGVAGALGCEIEDLLRDGR